MTPTAAELLAGYRARSRSPVEAVQARLEAIERDEPRVHAFCLVDPEGALAAARESEARWARGEPSGRLDGVPVAVKDVFLAAGWPTLRGFPVAAPDAAWVQDAPAVAALRRHGAVLVGKTTTPQLGWKAVTDGPGVPATRNPVDPARTAGGSSSGSGAAVALGMAPLALGTDGGGSIRIPGAFCGVVGLKPTFARVPQWPPSPFGLLAHSGPMARTVADAALLLDVLAEPDPREWAALPPPPSSYASGLVEPDPRESAGRPPTAGAGRLEAGLRDLRAASPDPHAGDGVEHGLRGVRVAFSPDLGFAVVEPEVAASVAKAAAVLEEAGAHVERVDPGFADPRATFDVLWSAGAGRAVGMLSPEQREHLDPGLAALAQRGAARSGAELLEAEGQRAQLGAAMGAFHAQWDLLVTPTVPIAAFEAKHEAPPGAPDPHWPGWTPFTYPFNITQQPALTVPCGSTAAGLPIGLQIVGPRHAERLVLRAGRAYEHRREP